MPTTITGSVLPAVFGDWVLTFEAVGGLVSTGRLCAGCSTWCDSALQATVTLSAVNTKTNARTTLSASADTGKAVFTLPDGTHVEAYIGASGAKWDGRCSGSIPVTVTLTSYQIMLNDFAAEDVTAGATVLSHITGLPPDFFSDAWVPPPPPSPTAPVAPVNPWAYLHIPPEPVSAVIVIPGCGIGVIDVGLAASIAQGFGLVSNPAVVGLSSKAYPGCPISNAWTAAPGTDFESGTVIVVIHEFAMVYSLAHWVGAVGYHAQPGPVAPGLKNAKNVADALNAAGATISGVNSGADVQKVIQALPPSTGLIHSQLASVWALALGVPYDVVLAVADEISANFLRASPWLASKDAGTPAAQAAVIAALETLPASLRPPPSSETRPAGCSALNYVWSDHRGTCFLDVAARDAAEAPAAVPALQPTAPASPVSVIIQSSAQDIAAVTGASAVSVAAHSDQIAAEISRQGLTAQQITTDPAAAQRAAQIAAQVTAGKPGISPLLVVGVLAAVGAVWFILLRRRRS